MKAHSCPNGCGQPIRDGRASITSNTLTTSEHWHLGCCPCCREACRPQGSRRHPMRPNVRGLPTSSLRRTLSKSMVRKENTRRLGAGGCSMNLSHGTMASVTQGRMMRQLHSYTKERLTASPEMHFGVQECRSMRCG
jgi:hypothetical protein